MQHLRLGAVTDDISAKTRVALVTDVDPVRMRSDLGRVDGVPYAVNEGLILRDDEEIFGQRGLTRQTVPQAGQGLEPTLEIDASTIEKTRL
jgi:hypothetical protein